MIKQTDKFGVVSVSGAVLFILFLSSFNFSFRTLADIDVELVDYSNLHRIVGFFILFFYVFFKFPKIAASIASNKFLLFFSVYVVYRIVTTIWSIFPIWSFYRAVEFSLVFLFFVSFLDREASPPVIMKTLNRLVGLYLGLLLTVVIGVFVSPEEALSRSDNLLPQIKGVFPRWNSNGIGQVTAVLAGIAIIYFSSYRNKASLMLIMIVFPILVLAQTRSAIAPLLLFSIYFFTVNVNLYVKTIVYLILGILCVGLIVSSDAYWFIWDYLARGQDSEQLLTLSSRLIVWESSIANANFGLFNFLFGLGAFAGGRFIAEMNFESTSAGSPLTTLDNTWLELWVDEGLVGVIFVVFIFVWILKLLRASDGSIIKSLGYCLFSILFFRSFFVSSTLLHTNFFFMILVLITAHLNQKHLTIGKHKISGQ